MKEIKKLDFRGQRIWVGMEIHLRKTIKFE